VGGANGVVGCPNPNDPVEKGVVDEATKPPTAPDVALLAPNENEGPDCGACPFEA